MNKAEEIFMDLNKFEKVLFGLGAMFFILAFAFTLFQTGFQLDSNAKTPPVKFFTYNELWIVNIALGAVGGFIMRPKNHIISILCGVLITVCITWFTYQYLYWRDSAYIVEIIILLPIEVIPGLHLYKYICKRMNRKV